MATTAPAPLETINEEDKQSILELCETNREGITIPVINNSLPNLTNKEIMAILNKLLLEKKLELAKRGNINVFKLSDPSQHFKLKGITREDQAVFNIIKSCGSKGIWAREIRKHLNLHVNVILKTIKRLETKKYIKSINSVHAPKKKIYLVCGVEPDFSLTGGAFYTDNQFDSAFVEILMTTCYNHLEEKAKSAPEQRGEDSPLAVLSASNVSAKEMMEYIEKLKIIKGQVKLSVEDVKKLLDTLVLDGRVHCYTSGGADNGGGVKLWRAVPDWAPTMAMVSSPCGVCPLIDRCSNIGSTTPQSCEYFKDWLA